MLVVRPPAKKEEPWGSLETGEGERKRDKSKDIPTVRTNERTNARAERRKALERRKQEKYSAVQVA